jgi:hypothetical protein
LTRRDSARGFYPSSRAYGPNAMVGIGTESALALSVLLGVTALANGLVGLLPLTLGGERFVATRAQYAEER